MMEGEEKFRKKSSLENLKNSENHVILYIESERGGKMRSRLNAIYWSMRTRCENSNSPSFINYGRKGIRVCDEWQDYNSFKKWSMDNGYQDDLTIDRINPTQGYCPQNCRWISIKEQQSNRTNNHLITFQSRTLTLQQWGEELGIKWTTLYGRLNRGWSIEKALSTPVKNLISN